MNRGGEWIGVESKSMQVSAVWGARANKRCPMGRSHKVAARVLGPYQHRRGWRLVLIDREGAREYVYYRERADADADRAKHARRCEVRNGTRRGWVYFVRPEGPDVYVKIGVARDIDRRMPELQLAWPVRLIVIGKQWSDDAVALERDLHRRFAHLHVRGEWHRLTGDLAAYIAGLPEPSATVPPC